MGGLSDSVPKVEFLCCNRNVRKRSRENSKLLGVEVAEQNVDPQHVCLRKLQPQ
jgi:hypothetical protein